MNSKEIYHPQLLALFNNEELDLLTKASILGYDDKGRVNVLVVNTDKFDVEIYTDLSKAKAEKRLLLKSCMKRASHMKIPYTRLIKKHFGVCLKRVKV